MKRYVVGIGVGTVVLVVSLVGFRYLHRASIGSPDSVHITVTQIDPAQTESVIFDQSFTQQAKPIYDQLTSDVLIASLDQAKCPAYTNQQPYYRYELAFYRMGALLATATSDAIGCARIDVAYSDGTIDRYAWETQNDVSFWEVLHQLVNAPEPIGTCVNSTCSGG